jgi:hypothetical protein
MKITIETKSEKMIIETKDENIITHSEPIHEDKNVDWDAWQKDFYDRMDSTSENGGV